QEDWKRDQRVALYKTLLIVVGGGVMLFDVVRVWRQPFDYRWLVLAVLAVVGGWVSSARMPGAGPIVTVSDAFVFLALLLLGREYATMVAGVSAFSDIRRHTKRWFTVAASVGLTCFSYFLSASVINSLFGNLKLLEHQRQSFFI